MDRKTVKWRWPISLILGLFLSFVSVLLVAPLGDARFYRWKVQFLYLILFKSGYLPLVILYWNMWWISNRITSGAGYGRRQIMTCIIVSVSLGLWGLLAETVRGVPNLGVNILQWSVGISLFATILCLLVIPRVRNRS